LYLKAIGILRLVAEQKDPEARGWRPDGHFGLLAKPELQDIERFLLEDDSPTLIFNPWGGRSGFYGGSSEKNSRIALPSAEESLRRLVHFRWPVAKVRRLVRTMGGSKTGAGEEKTEFATGVRRETRDGGSVWLATVLADPGGEICGLPILGPGGNQQSGSHTAAWFAAIRECIVVRSRDGVLATTLFCSNDEMARSWDRSFYVASPNKPGRDKTEVVKGPFRQFLPEGPRTPWGLLLTFEGACAFRSGLAKGGAAGPRDRLVSSPFYLSPHGARGLTSCGSDDFVIDKGRRQPGRGEPGCPLWRSPATCREIQTLLCEGRCSVGPKQAREPIDAVRAIGRLGLNRGITAFVRYGYWQGNNLATHIAVLLGRVRVRQESTVHLVNHELASWLDRIHREAGGPTSVCDRQLPPREPIEIRVFGFDKTSVPRGGAGKGDIDRNAHGRTVIPGRLVFS